MPLLGNLRYSTSHASYDGNTYALKITVSQAMTFPALYARVGALLAANTYGYICDDNGSGRPGTIRYTTSRTGGHTGTVRFPFSTPVTLQPGTYHIGIKNNEGGYLTDNVRWETNGTDDNCTFIDQHPLTSWSSGATPTNYWPCVWLDTEDDYTHDAEVGAKASSFTNLLLTTLNGLAFTPVYVRKRATYGAMFMLPQATNSTVTLRPVVFKGERATYTPKNGPKRLLATGPVQTGVTANTYKRLPLASPLTLDPGIYWIGIWTSAEIRHYCAYSFTATTDRTSLLSPYQGVTLWPNLSKVDGTFSAPGDILETGTSDFSSSDSATGIWYLGEGVAAPLPPTLSLSPNEGTWLGGTTVTCTGSGFTNGNPSLTFGDLPATNVTVVNNTTLTCVTPYYIPGYVDVAATVSGVTTTYTRAYKYTNQLIITPNRGPLIGGNTVSIQGFGEIV